MNQLNLNATISLVIGLITLLTYSYVAIRQFNEVLQPKDWLSRLRQAILVLLLMSLIALTPSLAYQFLRALGHDYTVLRNVASIAGNISRLGGSLIVLFIFHYKRKD